MQRSGRYNHFSYLRLSNWNITEFFQKKTFFFRRSFGCVKTMLFSILFGRFVLFSYLCKDFLLKFFLEIFGGYRKSIYLCNRKRETNAAHNERCGSLSETRRKSSLKDLHRQIYVVQERYLRN